MWSHNDVCETSSGWGRLNCNYGTGRETSRGLQFDFNSTTKPFFIIKWITSLSLRPSHPPTVVPLTMSFLIGDEIESDIILTVRQRWLSRYLCDWNGIMDSQAVDPLLLHSITDTTSPTPRFSGNMERGWHIGYKFLLCGTRTVQVHYLAMCAMRD